MTFAALLFDFDGLILDTETPEYHAWREIYSAHGHELELELWAQAIGTHGGFDPVAELMRRTDGHVHDDVLDGAIQRAQARLDAELLRPGVESLWEQADEAGIPRAVVTSSTTDWVTDNLGRFHMHEGWAAIVSANGDAERAKPRPTLYLEACDLLEVPPAEAVVIEDSPNGVAAARAAGIPVIAVPNEVTASLDLSAADVTVETLQGLTLADLGDLLSA